MKLPLSLLLALAGAALAQGAPPLTLNLTQSLIRTVTVSGKSTEQRAPSPASVRPGDVLAQSLTARNSGKTVLNGVRVQLPVPRNTVYLALDGETRGVKAEYSIDGGQTFAPAPLKKKVSVTENGRAVIREVEVKPNEYQAVRWTVGTLAAGAEQTLGFRVQVK